MTASGCARLWTASIRLRLPAAGLPLSPAASAALLEAFGDGLRAAPGWARGPIQLDAPTTRQAADPVAREPASITARKPAAAVRSARCADELGPHHRHQARSNRS
jgi:hypothetical protein